MDAVPHPLDAKHAPPVTNCLYGLSITWPVPLPRTPRSSPTVHRPRSCQTRGRRASLRRAEEHSRGVPMAIQATHRNEGRAAIVARALSPRRRHSCRRSCGPRLSVSGASPLTPGLFSRREIVRASEPEATPPSPSLPFGLGVLQKRMEIEKDRKIANLSI